MARLGLDDRVSLVGFVDDVTKQQLLGRAWALAMPSSNEGWGLCAVEAVSATLGYPSRVARPVTMEV